MKDPQEEPRFGDYKGQAAIHAKLRVLIMDLSHAQTAWQKADMLRKSTEPPDELTKKEQRKQSLIEDYNIMKMVELKGLLKPGNN